MTLPQLPTDNLYKFMFLAGLTIIGVSAFLYVQKYIDINNKIDDIEVDVLNSELAFFKDSANITYETAQISKAVERDSHLLSKIKSKLSTKILVPSVDTLDLEGNINNSITKIKMAKKNLVDSDISSYIESKKIEYKLKKLKESNHLLMWLGIFCATTCLLGYVLARKGYLLWKVKVQNLTDEKLSLELKKLREENVSTS